MKSKIFGGLAVGLCLMSGCGSSNSTGGSGSNSAAVSQEAAAATASEATAIATSMTETEVSASGGSPEVARSAARPETAPACASVDVKSTGADGQWTDEVLTFAAPPCEFTGARGYATLDVTGTLELTRTNGDGYNFTSNATNLEWAFTNPSGTYSETRNGTRDITASASAASATSNITIAYVGAVHSGTLQHQMTSAFTPASGLSLVQGQPLPSGDFTHTGSVTWTGGDGNTGTFGVTTVTPLAYDSTCKNTQPSVFDSGELHLHLSTDSGNDYAKVVWSGCAAPTITFVAD